MKIGIDPDAPPVFLTPVSVERFPLMGADGYAERATLLRSNQLFTTRQCFVTG